MTRRVIWVLAASVAMLTTVAGACDTPVFQYALENWEPDRYQAVVFHSGSLDAEVEQILSSVESNAHLNLRVMRTDVDGAMDEPLRKLWEAQASSELPWLAVLMPRVPYGVPPEGLVAWAGPLTEENVRLLADSPVRREIAKGLLDGEAPCGSCWRAGMRRRTRPRRRQSRGNWTASRRNRPRMPPTWRRTRWRPPPGSRWCAFGGMTRRKRFC